jgi:GNAT superfamily N-acetyltransferase
MFTGPNLAARIDQAEGRLCAGIAKAIADADPQAASAVFDVADGVGVFAGRGSPTNKLIGVGFAELPTADALETLEQHFAAQESPLQAEIATLANPALHAMLTLRGYRSQGFENVLGCAPDTVARTDPPAGIAITAVAEGDRDRWIDVVVEAFAAPDVGGVGGDTVPPSDELRRWMSLTMRTPGFECVAAYVDGRIAGGAALRIDGDIAQFCGAATLPAFRRRGVQTALLRWRLAHAATRGCRVAVVTTQPASKSQENVQRQGFALLYARQLLVRMPPPA